jgi:predicted ATPase
LIMLEEPENGLHPARIREVMNILKDLAKNGTQVLLTTHSPLVLNELEANQVTVLWRRDGEGARSTLMSKTADFEKRSEVFSLAELWLNYCNGFDEKPLIEGPTP